MTTFNHIDPIDLINHIGHINPIDHINHIDHINPIDHINHIDHINPIDHINSPLRYLPPAAGPRSCRTAVAVLVEHDVAVLQREQVEVVEVNMTAGYF